VHRESVDPERMTAADILCDFCHQPWLDPALAAAAERGEEIDKAASRPMVEGHRGACICVNCLSIAYAELLLHRIADDRRDGEICIMCREERDQSHWRSPLDEVKLICLRCCKQAAGVLHKDPEVDWRKPA